MPDLGSNLQWRDVNANFGDANSLMAQGTAQLSQIGDQKCPVKVEKSSPKSL